MKKSTEQPSAIRWYYVQAIIVGIEPTPAALHDLFKRAPVPVKAQAIALDDLTVLGFRVTL